MNIKIKRLLTHPLLLVGLIFITGILTIIFLLTFIGGPTIGNNVSTFTNFKKKLPADAPNLNYPNATILNFDFEKIWPDTDFKKTFMEAFSTTDNYLKVSKFYKENLASQGYNITTSPVCIESNCTQEGSLEAESDRGKVMLVVFSYKNLSLEYSKIPDVISNKIKPGWFLVFYQYLPREKV